MTSRSSAEVRILSDVSYDAWPSPESSRGPLPRIEDLPIAEQGYDQEAVREAFDSFYRHAAQLDASLRALEAVEVFRRDAGELRSDLRSLRSLGFGGEPSWAASTYQVGRPRREIPSAVPRLAAEAVLVITVAVIAGVAGFRPLVIVALMAAAWAIVVVVEWLAARSRVRMAEASPFTTYAQPEGEPAPYVEVPPTDPAVGWSAFEAAAAQQPAAKAQEELTMIEEPPAELERGDEGAQPEQVAEPEYEPVAAATEPEVVATVAEADPVSDEPKQRGWFGRRRQSGPPGSEQPEEPAPLPAVEPPSHVRVLASDDPWERGFDGDDEAENEQPEHEPEAGPAPASRGRFRRR
jgi:hypothetical protein